MPTPIEEKIKIIEMFERETFKVIKYGHTPEDIKRVDSELDSILNKIYTQGKEDGKAEEHETLKRHYEHREKLAREYYRNMGIEEVNLFN